MFVLHKDLNGRHLTTAFYQWGEDQKRCRLTEEEAWAGAEAAITAYRTPFAPVTPFKYIRRVLLAEDDDWPAVVSNRRRDQ